MGLLKYFIVAQWRIFFLGGRPCIFVQNYVFLCNLLDSIGDRKLENISSKEHKTFHILPSFFLNVDNSYNIAPSLFKIDVVISNIKTKGNVSSVFEIKGAPCTLCAHFGCRVHGF